MFDIGWGELVVIGVVALIAIGPKELPGVLRTAGQWMGKMRRMASEFQGQFQEAMREAEIADLKKEFDDAANAASNVTRQIENPLESTRKEIESSFADTPADKPAEPPAGADNSATAPSAPAKPEGGAA
jgi:sec-independent protein translocase protein TatB